MDYDPILSLHLTLQLLPGKGQLDRVHSQRSNSVHACDFLNRRTISNVIKSQNEPI